MKRVFIALALVLLVLSSGVFASGSQDGGSGQNGEISLVLWDQFYRGTENDIMNSIVEKFEAQNPGIKIIREEKTLDDLKLTLQMSVQSGKGPDIMQLNQGEADMGAFVKSGLVSDLTDVAEDMGWIDRLSKANLKSMGYKGRFYGISVTGEVVGFFYNKALFKEMDLSIPETLEELEMLMAKVKSVGFTPINFGNLDGWTGIHEWSSIQHVLTSRNELDNMMSGNPGNYWNNPANIEAAKILKSWVDKGFFTKDFSAIGYDDSASVFYQGKSALMLTGNWLMGDIDSNAPFEAGFFLLPAPKGESKNLKAVGGPGIPFVISSKSEKQEAAIKFLDFLTTENVAAIWAENGMLPALPISESSVPNAGDLFKDILKSYKQVNENNGMGYFIDWITPTFYDTSSAAVQQLMNGSLTAVEFSQSLQDDYDNFVK